MVRSVRLAKLAVALTPVNCVWLSALNASRRTSNLARLPAGNDFDTDMSRLFVGGAHMKKRADSAPSLPVCGGAKQFAIYKSAKFEFRVDAFNALNHTQYTGVNATANFASLTDRTITNLPYNASGQLVNKNGFGTINGVNIPRTLQLVTRVTF